MARRGRAERQCAAHGVAAVTLKKAAPPTGMLHATLIVGARQGGMLRDAPDAKPPHHLRRGWEQGVARRAPHRVTEAGGEERLLGSGRVLAVE